MRGPLNAKIGGKKVRNGTPGSPISGEFAGIKGGGIPSQTNALSFWSKREKGVPGTPPNWVCLVVIGNPPNLGI